MSELTQTQVITKTITIVFMVIEIYLMITNVTFVAFKLRYYLPPLLKHNRRARRYRCLAELSRSGFLFCVTAYTVLKISWTGMFAENTAHWPCRLVFRVPTLYFYFILNCRILFAYSRLVLFKLCMEESFMYETIGVIVTVLFFFAVFVWGEVKLRAKVVNGVCFNIISTGLTISGFVSLFIYEITSFILYYKPLKEADGISRRNLNRRCPLLSTTDKLKPDRMGGREESSLPKDFESMSVESHPSSKKRTFSFQISISSVDIINKFHKIVRRNFWAGVTTMCAGLAVYTLFVLFDSSTDISKAFGITSSERTWYWGSGVGQVLEQVLSVTMYATMMFTENNWRRAFTPFFLWQKEVWDV